MAHRSDNSHAGEHASLLALADTGSFTQAGRALGKHPTVLLADALKLAGEQARVVAGVSTVTSEKGDRRFNDPAWDFKKLSFDTDTAAGSVCFS